jgi:hypothetical protein
MQSALYEHRGAVDLVNRIAISLVALVVLVAAIVTLLVATEAIEGDFFGGGPDEAGWFYEQLYLVADLGGGGQAIAIAVPIVVAILMAGFISLEIVTATRRQTIVRISVTGEGASTIEGSSVELLAERTAHGNRSISSIRCRIRWRMRPVGGGPSGIVIHCYPVVSMGSNVQEIRDDLQTRIKASVEQLTGLVVLQVNVVRVRYNRDDEGRLVVS